MDTAVIKAIVCNDDILLPHLFIDSLSSTMAPSQTVKSQVARTLDTLELCAYNPFDFKTNYHDIISNLVANKNSNTS